MQAGVLHTASIDAFNIAVEISAPVTPSTSLILSIWFLGGVQLLCIGLIGQYIGKIYVESKHRPRYNIEKILSDEEA